MEDLSSSSQFSLSSLLCNDTFLNDEATTNTFIDQSNFICSTPKSGVSRSNYQEALNLFGDKHVNERILVCEDTSIPQRYHYSVSEDDEFVRKLIHREIGNGFGRPQSSNNAIRDDSIQFRSDEIKWIFHRSELLRFRVETAYLSVTYLDRFLSLSSLLVDFEDHWAIRLLSVACLCLAAKIEQGATRLSRISGREHKFDKIDIRIMEQMVVETLGWKMILVTPLDYIHYLDQRFCYGNPPEDSLSRSTKFILDIMREINLMDYRPSVIAVAAALLALDQNLTRQTLEFKINMFSSKGIPEIENVFYFYNRMRELQF